MRDTIEQLEKEEKELEQKMLGTPTDDVTTDEVATDPKVVTEEAPAKEEELVAPKPAPVMDEQPKEQTGEDWEKRYKNLRASRDEKSYKTKAQLAAALETINTLQVRINELEKAKPAVDPLAGVFTDEDTDQLGEATVDAMRRATQKATEAATAPLQEQLKREKELREQTSVAQAQAAKQDAYNTFLGRVARAVPDWEEINYDPGFEAYMAQPDVDGTLRKTYFANAEAQGNAAQVIKYMMEYKAQKPAPPVDKLADKVTPVGDDAGATQPKSNEVKGISKAFIDKFYDDLTRGKYQGRATEANEIEAKIDAAIMRGEIVA